VFIPKYRRKVLYGKIRRALGGVFHELAKQRESEIVEGHLCPDHVHMLIRIPPKYSVSEVMGYIKGKSAIRAARDFMGRHRSFKGYHFWARGYFVSTVGIDERTIREYIREQEKNDQKLDQQKLF
jgi:putative transposase